MVHGCPSSLDVGEQPIPVYGKAPRSLLAAGRRLEMRYPRSEDLGHPSVSFGETRKRLGIIFPAVKFLQADRGRAVVEKIFYHKRQVADIEFS